MTPETLPAATDVPNAAVLTSETLHISALKVDGEPTPGVTRGGILITATRTEPVWRVHVYTTRNSPWTEREEHELEIWTREGERVLGLALLRQSDGWGHLFVGVGALTRFAAATVPDQ